MLVDTFFQVQVKYMDLRVRGQMDQLPPVPGIIVAKSSKSSVLKLGRLTENVKS